MKTNQKMTLRRLGALLLVLAMTFALASCGSKTFDASGYVDASLKQVTTGDTKALEAYEGQAVVTTAEDYDKELQDMIESITGSMELSDSNLNLVKDLVKELLGNASYQVGEATEQDDGSFEVPLTIKPLQLNIADAVTEWIKTLDADKINDMDALYGEIFQMMRDAVAKKEYGAEKSYTLTVAKNDDGLYDVTNDGLDEIGEDLFTTDLDSLME